MDKDSYWRDPSRRNPNSFIQTPTEQNVGSRSSDNDLNDPFANQIESFRHLLPNRSNQPTPTYQRGPPDTMPVQGATGMPSRAQPSAHWHRIPSSAYSMYPDVPDVYAPNPPTRPANSLDSSDPRSRRCTSGNELPQNTASNYSAYPQSGSHMPSQAPEPSRGSVGMHAGLQAQGHPFLGDSTSNEPQNRHSTTLPIRPPNPMDYPTIRRDGQRRNLHDHSRILDDLNTWMCIYCEYPASPRVPQMHVLSLTRRLWS